jgi:hypothetical protein
MAAVELRDMFDDREAETGAANAVVASRFIGTVEPLENPRQIFFVDTVAVVAYA